MFILNENKNLKYLTVDEFSKTGLVKHCFSTRYGGVSKGDYSTMNLRFNASDERENVLKNFEIISSEVGIDYTKLVLTKQVHEDIIEAVGVDYCGNGIMFGNRFQSADGLICSEKGVPITVFGADCLPVMFLDYKQRVIATAHSGWKGTLKKIAQKCAYKMIKDYNSKPEDIIAAIGPSIRVENYEVSDELALLFEKEFGKTCVTEILKKPHIDMQMCVKLQLEEIGVTTVVDSMLCTYKNPDLFFSHRRTGDRRGVMVGMIELI